MRFLIDSGKPLVVDFISTRCSSLCPGLSNGFSVLLDTLGTTPGSVQLVSISTDPDNDGPEQMKEYLAKYKAGEEWNFLSGSREDIERVMKALDATAGGTWPRFPSIIFTTRFGRMGARKRSSRFGGAPAPDQEDG